MKKIFLVLILFCFLYGAGENWTLLSPTGTPPSGRWGAASVYDTLADRFIVFGGAIWGAAYNNLYALDGTASGNGAWTQLTPTGSIPGARGFCAPVYDAPRRRMIIFGGYNMSASCYNHVYFLDSLFQQSPRWTYVSVSGSAPTIRQSSAAAYDPIQERVIYFSGWCGYSWKNDLYVLENIDSSPSWRRLFPTGGGPGGRWGASCIYDYNNDRLYVFGGMNTAQAYPNDVWVLDSLQTSDGHWTQLSPGGSIPTGRMWLASVYDGSCDRMLLFGGGYFQSSALNDLRSLDPLSSTPSWSLISATGTSPSARLGPSWALDEPRNRLIIFGGNYYSNNYNNVYVLTWDTGISEDKTPAVNRPIVAIEPNPFRNSTTINFEGDKGFILSVMVFDCQGRLIKTCSSDKEQLPCKVAWDGKDENGFEVSSGAYFVIIKTDEGDILKRVVKIF